MARIRIVEQKLGASCKEEEGEWKNLQRTYLFSLLEFCFTTGCVLKVDRKCGDRPIDAVDLPNLDLDLPVKENTQTIDHLGTL